MKRDVRAVLFDWDGTLVDSAEPAYRSYVRMFADFGVHFDREIYARTYSPAWEHTYRCVNLPKEHWREADRRWLEYFDEETTAPLVAGAAEALDMLAKKNVACGIVTSGTRRRIVRELAAHGVDRHFIHVVCGDDGPRRKPDPEALRVCLDRLGVAPKDAAYIGDSAEDVMMARAAGVFCVGIRGTYPNHDTLVAALPDFVADSVADAVEHALNARRRRDEGS